MGVDEGGAELGSWWRRPVPLCLTCDSVGAYTEAAADESVARIGGLVEKVACAAGAGWHLRIRKESRGI